ncbi:MAG: TM2 domain-containing protein [Clostridia bacterium]|nr:TM2 domain-containing protein [Clostridia bacterium]
MAIEQICECEYCGYKSREKAVKCPLCGASLKVVEKVIADAYYESTKTNTTTHNTTHTKQSNNYTPLLGEKNRIIAALLAFFAGSIGLHKFYMGNIASGIMYIIFWWTAIPSILSFIDGISLLCMTDSKFNYLVKKHK